MQQQLEKYFWGTATYLLGNIDAGDYKQYIFPWLFFKRICDVYDEEFQQALKDAPFICSEKPLDSDKLGLEVVLFS